MGLIINRVSQNHSLVVEYDIWYPHFTGIDIHRFYSTVVGLIPSQHRIFPFLWKIKYIKAEKKMPSLAQLHFQIP